jgi:sterol desaturase/sphingolipid hydroxylase (fatty acid hydroxylase superfamily)
MLNLLATTGLTFVVLVLVFRPLELAFPAKLGQRFFRPGFLMDLCFFLGRHLLWGGIVFWLLLQVRVWVDSIAPSDFRAAVAHQPWWLQAVEAVFLSDLFMYWGHRLQHRLPFLWRFHAVHHSSEHMDWLAGHREHPLDSIYTMTLINFPPMVLGFPLETIASFLLLRGVWAAYIHSNVRLPIGPLHWFIGAPELHHWHHYRDRDVGNYCNLSPLMDILFGTYHCPDHEPQRFGINEPTPRTYWGYMIQSLLPRRWRREAHTGDGAHKADADSFASSCRVSFARLEEAAANTAAGNQTCRVTPKETIQVSSCGL